MKYYVAHEMIQIYYNHIENYSNSIMYLLKTD